MATDLNRETDEATEARERLVLFTRTVGLLPKYAGLAALAMNQASLLVGFRFESADHYTALVADFEAWYEAFVDLPEFTEEMLSPTRTLRRMKWPLRDRLEVLVGDELLVDATAYAVGPEPVWCVVTSIAPGSASTYPYKVRVPDKGEAQFRASEVLGWRRPLWFHRDLMATLYETPQRDHDPLLD